MFRSEENQHVGVLHGDDFDDFEGFNVAPLQDTKGPSAIRAGLVMR